MPSSGIMKTSTASEGMVCTSPTAPSSSCPARGLRAARLFVAAPLAPSAARRPRAGQLLLGAVGLVQTIPSLAVLVFMIPLLGIGARPAIAALFLYSLLPIVRNTAAGLSGIPPEIRDSAEALGALIGAGGYGQPILTGIRLADLGLILEGAVPAALLALLAQALFELLGRSVVPRGLRL